MKKLLLLFASIMASVVLMAQSQLYVIMKDGSGASFPEATVDSLTFNDKNGAVIYGLGDIVKKMDAMQKSIDSLKGVLSSQNPNIPSDTTSFKYEYVDLGLPSGTLWATCNIGAKTPNEYGYYICWGETDKKMMYMRTSGTWYGKEVSELRSEGVIDQYHNLTAKYDAATVLWGDEWRMPTLNEINELLNYCAQQYTQSNGIDGVLFTSTLNSKSIFLPCGGMIMNNEKVMEGTRGYYIGSTVSAGKDGSSGMYLAQGDFRPSSASRSHGRSIRPVRKKANEAPFIDTNLCSINGMKYVDLGLPSGTLWADCNLGSDSSHHEGNQFIWGKVTPYSSNDTTSYSLVSEETLRSKGITDSNNNLTANYDAANYLLGGAWRMPTAEECKELLNYCKIGLKTINGVEGFQIIGTNAKTIFIPKSEPLSDGFALWSSTSASLFDDTTANVLSHYGEHPSYSPDYSHLRQRHSAFPIRPVVNLKK